MQASNVTRKGQVTIPAEIRHELGIAPGSRVRFVRKGRAVLIEGIKEPAIESVFGVLKLPKGKGVEDIDAAIERAKSRRAARRSSRR